MRLGLVGLILVSGVLYAYCGTTVNMIVVLPRARVVQLLVEFLRSAINQRV